MASRHELQELGGVEIMGVPIVPVIARGRRVVFAVGGYDADGLLETMEDVKRVAARWRGKLDETPTIGKD